MGGQARLGLVHLVHCEIGWMDEEEERRRSKKKRGEVEWKKQPGSSREGGGIKGQSKHWGKEPVSSGFSSFIFFVSAHPSQGFSPSSSGVRHKVGVDWETLEWAWERHPPPHCNAGYGVQYLARNAPRDGSGMALVSSGSPEFAVDPTEKLRGNWSDVQIFAVGMGDRR